MAAQPRGGGAAPAIPDSQQEALQQVSVWSLLLCAVSAGRSRGWRSSTGGTRTDRNPSLGSARAGCG